MEDGGYAALQSWSRVMQEEPPPVTQADEKAYLGCEWDCAEGGDGLPRFMSLPPAWPLARLMIPIKNLVRQMETLLQCYCFETVAVCRCPERQDAYVHRVAKDLAQFSGHIPCGDGYRALAMCASLPF